jgi:ribonuclease D
MDPVSALGVASAACQFAESTAKVAQNLYRYYETAKNAPKLSRELRKEALLLSDLLEDLRDTMSVNMPGVESSRNVANSDLASETLKEFEVTIKEIAARAEVAENELSWNRIRWPFTYEENQSYLQRFERFKSTFQLTLQSLQK